MPDYIGNISVPVVSSSGTAFPLVSDFGYGRAHAPSVVVHRFQSGNTKIEQRFFTGNGQTRFTVVLRAMGNSEFTALQSFWESTQGGYRPFTYSVPSDDGNSTTDYLVRFADDTLTFERLVSGITSTGLTLIAVPADSDAPSYTLGSTQARFPSSALQAAMLSQVQRIIPLVKIQPKESGYPAIYVSDRRCTVGSQLYQARLLDWGGISQELGNTSDSASFTFGNADRVMTELAKDVYLERAWLEFSLFHVGTGNKIDLWAGEIIDWNEDAGNEFPVTASEGLYDLNLLYPRKISRTCQKEFNDGVTCPYASAGSGGDPSFCDKSFDGAKGCTSHGMAPYYGGIFTNPQGVYLKQVGGIFRRAVSYITSVSTVSDTIYDKVLKDIYTDDDMEVTCDIAAGREESEFYNALGIVGRGSLGAYGIGHTLDGQEHHGPGNLGLRRSYGHDPATNHDPDNDSDKFSLGNGNPTVYATTKAAGVAFLEIRRKDEKGQQLSRLSDHAMKAVVSQGLSGFKWTAPGSRTTGLLTNPVWIAVNILLEGKGLHFASAAQQEKIFDVSAAIASAAICDLSVAKLIGSGNETQFKFRGRLEEQKSLRDWMQEILMNSLGYFTNSFGKVRVGTRINSSTVEAFSAGNILFQSLQLSPMRPAYNHLTANFADEEFKYAANSIEVYDIDHAKLIGGGPVQFLKGTINLSGCPSKSQAARVISTRLREELGGTTMAEWKNARRIRFKTTVLALNTEVGQVCSITSPDMPGGSGEFRIQRWTLNKDYSIDIEGRTTTDSMYDLTDGPKPADVLVSPVPVEYFPSPERPVWHANTEIPDVEDALVSSKDRTFGLTQEYATLAEGAKQAAIIVTGELPVNIFPLGLSPANITGSTTATTGGSLPADTSLFLAVCAMKSDGTFTPPSNVVSVQFAAGTSTNSVTIGPITWPTGTFNGYMLFGAADENMMCSQSEVTGALPTTITFSGPLKRSTRQMPNSNLRAIRIKAKRVAHAGVIGTTVTSVTDSTIVCAGLAGLSDNWANRYLMIISDASDGSAPVWNFYASAYNSALGTFSVTPNPGHLGVEAGDVLIVCAQATGAGATYIEDAKFQNGVYPLGMEANAEANENNLVRIWAGKGKGQVRRIPSNTATRLNIDPPWDTVPDSTSCFIVEAPGWELQAPDMGVANSHASVQTSIRLVGENILRTTMLVCGVAVNTEGEEAPEDYFSPFRLIYLYGAELGVKVIAEDYTVQRDDKTILVDATDGPITVTLLPGATMRGLSLLISRVDDVTANSVTVAAANGETLEGGVGSITLENQGDKLIFTAVQ